MNKYYICIIFIIILYFYISHLLYFELIFYYEHALPNSTIDLNQLYNYGLQQNKINLYYINMKKSIERKQRFLDRMNKFNNYNIIRVNAITPNTLSNYNIQPSLICSYTMKSTEYGCTLSHLNAIEMSYSNNDLYSLISEDDLIIKKNINWDYLISQLPNDWDIIQLYTIPLPDINYFSKKSIIKNNWLIKTKNSSPSTVLYLINKKGMQKVLTKYKSNNNIILSKHNKHCGADIIIYHNLNKYIFTIPIFEPEELDSTISPFDLQLRKLF